MIENGVLLCSLFVDISAVNYLKKSIKPELFILQSGIKAVVISRPGIASATKSHTDFSRTTKSRQNLIYHP